MDPEDLRSKEASELIDEINSLMNRLKDKDLKISSWYGCFNLSRDQNSVEQINRGYGYKALEGAVDVVNFPCFLYWEIIWIVLNNEFKPDQRLLDLGGSSSDYQRR